MTLAGQPSKIGGTIARVAGWLSLAGGWLLGLIVAALMMLISEGRAPEWAFGIGGGFAFVGSFLAWLLLRSGRDLQRSGTNEELATKHQAIFALANTRSGVLKALDVAQALQVTPKEADDILTALAKANTDTVTVDIDDNGNVLYRFPSMHWGGIAQMAPNAVSPNARVRGGVPERGAPAGPPKQRVTAAPETGIRVDAREPLESVEELAEADAPARRARS